jgi:STE24 endopeptidase
VSRILLLIILILWLARSARPPVRGFDPGDGAFTFLAGFALIVLCMGVWSRVLARHLSGENLHIAIRRFTRAMYFARLLIPAWFAVGLFALGWASLVEWMLGRVAQWPVEVPGAILGTLPALLAWVGLWWAQYPADRALREQSMLVQLNEDLPIHRGPGLWGYVSSNLRLQVLFTLIPVLLILFLRDVACVVLWKTGVIEVDPADGTVMPQGAEIWVTVVALALVFVFVPEVLRHVLKTEPLPPGALRNRLESLCRRSGLKYRQILLWHTDNNMGNAAVMGILPQVRYILLSDLLLETMTNEQIEAVFAHEIGHVVHRHMSWYAVFIAIMMAGLFGPEQWIEQKLGSVGHSSNLRDMLNLVAVVAGCGGFFFLFGCLSRWFERQADVYAARTMQRYDSLGAGYAPQLAGASGGAEPGSYVGRYGAELFASALHRVAVINNIPLEPQRVRGSGLLGRTGAVLDRVVELANNWFHGSISTRMRYLRDLSGDPNRTSDFDRRMSVLYAMLVLALIVSGTALVVTVL